MKIAAVVVTYNRIILLKECIKVLRHQTRRLDEIIVVNNSSTDGTLEWLNLQKDLKTITQENSGSAGGQHPGIKIAYENGYDWIWCMDDDCFPEVNALEKLCEFIPNNSDVLNSLVVSNLDHSLLSFGLYDNEIKKFLIYYSDAKTKVIINNANFFNGTLISNKVVREVGFLSRIYLFEEMKQIIFKEF